MSFYYSENYLIQTISLKIIQSNILPKKSLMTSLIYFICHYILIHNLWQKFLLHKTNH
jgi:hypothetical protein